MNIQEIGLKIKGFWSREMVIILTIILVGVVSFGLGRLSVETVDFQDFTTETAQDEQASVVGSRSGSVYHLPWCSGAQNISDFNKVWFDSKEEAEKAGYRPAGNCKGLE